MSATNSTTHYNLPSFVGSDKPAWLVDWNGAMASIDSAIYEAKSTADQAVTAAAAVASDLATLSGTVSTQGSSITTLSETLTTAVGNINTINGNINTINSLIGNGTPTTTDQTLIGAINEINAKVGNGTPTTTSQTLIGAVNEINAEVGDINTSLTTSSGYASPTFTPTSGSITSFKNGEVVCIDFAIGLTAGSITADGVIATIADEYRPNGARRGVVYTNSGIFRIDVTAAGNISIHGNSISSVTEIFGEITYIL